jgi:GT2 family glycosyltransferase
VVDNAPATDESHRLVQERFAEVRYVVEPRPGLNWARNRAIEAARGELIAFTDDDVVVDAEWTAALLAVFTADPAVMAVTGLIVPLELETEAQVVFELMGGFGRGFNRSWYRLHPDPRQRNWHHLGAGRFGAGANMAFRKTLFTAIGGFDPALDVGTGTEGGGDLEMFFRLVQEGHTLVYEPAALVRHGHRQSMEAVYRQLSTWGPAVTAYLTRSALRYSGLWRSVLPCALSWLVDGYIRPLLGSLTHRRQVPHTFLLTPLLRAVLGPWRYLHARRRAYALALFDGASPPRFDANGGPLSGSPYGWRCTRENLQSTAVRTVDLDGASTNVESAACARTRVYVRLGSRVRGFVEIPNHFEELCAERVLDAIARELPTCVLDFSSALSDEERWKLLKAAVREYLAGEASPSATSPCARFSVVVATRDRPAALRRCLECLAQQDVEGKVELIVVDNNPASGLTAPVVTAFPGVHLVNETRRGLAYARNAGFLVSRGDIIATTDDDVVLPPFWLRTLVAPFARKDVMAVTGNVLPMKLETRAERAFESYGGLGRGFDRFEVGPAWFGASSLYPPATWHLGATANAAFRADALADEHIGLMDEALGPGTPTGVGEDTYLFYRILKEGYTIVYEPDAYVFHCHRETLPALRRQIYDYSRGHVAYLLTTLLRDGDWRALPGLLWNLPHWHLRRLMRPAEGYPRSLVLLEILGNLAGPIGLVRSRWRVRREGRSVAHRSASRGAEGDAAVLDFAG